MIEQAQDYDLNGHKMSPEEMELLQTDLLNEYLFAGNEINETSHGNGKSHQPPTNCRQAFKEDEDDHDMFDQFINKDMVQSPVDRSPSPLTMQMSLANNGLPSDLQMNYSHNKNLVQDPQIGEAAVQNIGSMQHMLTGNNMESWPVELENNIGNISEGWKTGDRENETHVNHVMPSSSERHSFQSESDFSYYQQSERLLNQVLQFGRTNPLKTIYLNPVEFLPKPTDATDLPFNLQVEGVPSVSRVETQIKVAISISPAPKQYLVHLPTDSITKQKFYLTNDVAELPSEIKNEMLFLETFLICSSTNKNTYVCARCVKREQRRAARRKSGVSDNLLWCNNENKRAVVLNSKQVILIKDKDCDQNSKNFALSARIVCYCRHHKEPEGFKILLVLRDAAGKVLGRTFTNPIMIMDRKTPTKSKALMSDSRSGEASSFAKEEDTSRVNSDASNTEFSRSMTEDESSKGVILSVPKSMPSPTSITEDSSENVQTDHGKVLPTSNFLHSSSVATARTNGYKRSRPSIDGNMRDSRSERSLSNSSASQLALNTSFFGVPASMLMQGNATKTNSQSSFVGVSQQRPHVQVQQMGSSLANDNKPFIQRVIPSQGPIKGGIEVTLLGSNFKPDMVVKFGENKALSIQCWSDSTLVTYLPPASKPGQVLVSVFQKDETNPELLNNMSNSRAIFTYVDDTDQQLIELALQIVGLKMNGKLEDARNIAKRIVGSDGGSSNGSTPNSNISPNNAYSLQGATSQVYHSDEMLIVKVVKLLNPSSNISMCSADGQTMLHLACLKGYFQLVSALVKKGARVNVEDRFGFTPLHFACVNGDVKTIEFLVQCKADVSIVARNGISAHDIYFSEHVMNHSQHNGYEESILEHLTDEPENFEFGSFSRKMSTTSFQSSSFDIESLDSLDDGFQVHVSKLVQDTLSDDSEYESSNYEDSSGSEAVVSDEEAVEVDVNSNLPSDTHSNSRLLENVIQLENAENAASPGRESDSLPKYEDLFPGTDHKNFKAVSERLETDITNGVFQDSHDSQYSQDSQDSQASEDEDEALQARLNRFFQQRQTFQNDKMLIFFWIPLMIVLSSAFLAFHFGRDGNKIHSISDSVSSHIRTWVGKTMLGNERMKAAFRESIHSLQNHRILGENNFTN